MLSGMAALIQGFGTTFIGKRDFWPDGSYVTTEWMVAFFFPLVPLRSLRVKPAPQRVTFLYVVGSAEREYVVCDETPPHARQVACVYCFAGFYLAWLFGLLFSLSRLDGRLGRAAETVLMPGMIAVPFVLPWMLRERAKKWRQGFK
jgi:hypothetical protein